MGGLLTKLRYNKDGSKTVPILGLTFIQFPLDFGSQNGSQNGPKSGSKNELKFNNFGIRFFSVLVPPCSLLVRSWGVPPWFLDAFWVPSGRLMATFWMLHGCLLGSPSLLLAFFWRLSRLNVLLLRAPRNSTTPTTTSTNSSSSSTTTTSSSSSGQRRPRPASPEGVNRAADCRRQACKALLERF